MTKVPTKGASKKVERAAKEAIGKATGNKKTGPGGKATPAGKPGPGSKAAQAKSKVRKNLKKI